MPISWLATSPSSTHCFGCCTKLPDQLEEDSDSDFGSLHDDPDLEKEEIRIDRAPSPGSNPNGAVVDEQPRPVSAPSLPEFDFGNERSESQASLRSHWLSGDWSHLRTLLAPRASPIPRNSAPRRPPHAKTRPRGPSRSPARAPSQAPTHIPSQQLPTSSTRPRTSSNSSPHRPTVEAPPDAPRTVSPFRKTGIFRPLQLSIYQPGNHLPELPKFSDDENVPEVPVIPDFLAMEKPAPTHMKPRSDSLESLQRPGSSFSNPRGAYAASRAASFDCAARPSFDSNFTIAGINVNDVLQPRSGYIEELRKPRVRRPSVATTMTSGSTQTFVDSVNAPLPPLPLATLKPTLKPHQNPESAASVFMRASEQSKRLKNHCEERERLESQCPVSPIFEENTPISPVSPISKLEAAAKQAAARMEAKNAANNKMQAETKSDTNVRSVSPLITNESIAPSSRAVSPIPEVKTVAAKHAGRHASALPAPLNPKKPSNNLLLATHAPTVRSASPLAAEPKLISPSISPTSPAAPTTQSSAKALPSRSASGKVHISQLAKQAKAQRQANKVPTARTNPTSHPRDIIRFPSPPPYSLPRSSSVDSTTPLNYKPPTSEPSAIINEPPTALKPRTLTPNTNTIVLKDPLVKPLQRLSQWLSKSILAAQASIITPSADDNNDRIIDTDPHYKHDPYYPGTESSRTESKMNAYSLASKEEIVNQGLRVSRETGRRSQLSVNRAAAVPAVTTTRASVSTYGSADDTMMSVGRPSSDVGGMMEKFPAAMVSAVGVAM